MASPSSWHQKYAHSIYRYHRWVIGVTAFLTLISIISSGLFLENRKGILDLYSHDNPVHKKFHDYVQEFGDPEDLIVVIQGNSRPQIKKFITDLAPQLQSPSVKGIFYRIDPSFIHEHGLMYLSLEDLESLRKDIFSPTSTLHHTLQSRNMNEFLSGLHHSIQNELAKVSGKINWDDATMGLNDLNLIFTHLNTYLSSTNLQIKRENLLSLIGEDRFQSNLAKQSQGKKRYEDPDGYLSVSEGDLYVMFVKPVDTQGNYEEAKALVTFVRSKIKTLNTQYPDLEIGVTGSPALTYDEVATSEKDMALASLIALITTALIFFLAFREFIRPLLAYLCLLMGVALTFGWTTLTIGHLNLISITFAIILIGLGTQYGIHVLSRYEEERRGDEDIEKALGRTIKGVSASLRTGALTTAAAFLATLIVDFSGFRELGFIAASGVVICLLMMLVTLPSLLVAYDLYRQQRKGSLANDIKDQTIHSQIILTAINIVDHFPKVILTIALALFLLSLGIIIFQRGSTDLDYNVINLQAQGTESVRYEKKLMTTDISLRFAVDVRPTLEEVEVLAKKVEILETVASTQYLGSLIPENQIQKLAILFDLKNNLKLTDLNTNVNIKESIKLTRNLKMELSKIEETVFSSGKPQLVNQVSQILDNLDLVINNLSAKNSHRLLAFQEDFLGSLKNFFKNSVEANSINLPKIPPDLKSHFLSPHGQYALYIYPSVPILEKDGLHRFVNDLRSVDPGITGPPFQMFEVLTSVETGYPLALLLAAGIILLIFYLDFRRLAPTLWAAFPLVLGLSWVYGAMSLFGIRWNLVNVITLPIVLGIGADCGVHIIHRFLEEGERDIRFIMKSTGKALAVAYLDTMTSFLGLAIAAHQGLASMGQIMIIGILCCFIAGIVVLPALLRVSIKN